MSTFSPYFVSLALIVMSTAACPKKVEPSPYRHDPWSLSPAVNFKQFRAWIWSLRNDDPMNIAAIVWVILSPILSVYAIFVATYQFNTVIFSLIYYILTSLSVTLCYHRLLSHRAFTVPKWVKAVLLTFCTSAMEGPALGWVRNHRAHHRYLDTDNDPYDATKGLWWSHMGWALQPFDASRFSEVDVADLLEDDLIMFQFHFYGPLAMLTGFLFPTLFCGFLWGDYHGGFWLGGILKMGLCLQGAFLVNSLAHYHGEHVYTDATTPVDSVFTNLVTTGEGYHNFHHAFPYDYRGCNQATAFDPLKWTIWSMARLGLAQNLKTFPDKLIDHSRLEMAKIKIERQLGNLAPCKRSDLPAISTADVKRRCQEGAKLMIVDGLVHDVSDFIAEHPGGPDIINLYIGKDATKAFYGTMVQHTVGAKQLLASLAMARIEDSKTD